MKKLLIIVIFLLLPITSWATTTTYYFALDGDNTKDCASWANRCKTIERMNAIMAGLSDVTDGNTVRVCGQEGDRWDTAAEMGSADKIELTVSGANAASRFILGACDSLGNWVSTRSSNPPIIDGNDTNPTGADQGLIHAADGEQYYTIENWRVTESNNDGMRLAGGASGDEHYGFIIRWTEVDNFDDSGIRCAKFCEDFNITQNYIHDGSLDCQFSCDPDCSGPDTGSGIVIALWSSRLAAGSSITENLIDGIGGEGIGTFRCRNDGFPLQIKRNVILNTRSGGFHATDVTFNFENNIIHNTDGGGSTNAYWSQTSELVPPNCDNPGHGIYLKCFPSDPWTFSITGTIIGNIISAGDYGMRISESDCSTDGDTIDNLLIYNNTIIANKEGASLNVSLSNGSGNEFKYNAITTADCGSCAVTDPGQQLGAWTIANNAYSATPSTGYDTFIVENLDLVSQTGLRWPDAVGNIAVSNFAPALGSPLIDTGVTRTLIDNDSDITSFPFTITTVSANEIGAVAYIDAPPEQGDTGLYGVIGGTGVIIHGDVQSVIPSND